MRAIKVIKDTILGKPFRADQEITNQKSGFEFRNQYKENPDRFECLECGQKLLAANSSNDNVYFRHFAHSEDCLLKDEDTDPEILQEHTKFLYARESERHKELKAQIGKSLSSTDGVDRDSIVVDSKFIIKDGKKENLTSTAVSLTMSWYSRYSFPHYPPGSYTTGYSSTENTGYT